MQGALEFKTEIELLSRIHHKNVVNLVGFCYEHGEQMLVYEYVPNGTLGENLSGASIHFFVFLFFLSYEHCLLPPLVSMVYIITYKL